MQKNLRALEADKFDDLGSAMNALYRPGPMEYIPNFIARKHGEEEIEYDLPEMAEILADTYGITVYQEQVMLLSQTLAGFSKGDADVLRKAMGKKIFALLEKLKPKFLSGCEERGHDVEIAEKIWKDWEALLPMPSISHALLAMLSLLFRQLTLSTPSCRIHGCLPYSQHE